MISSTLLEFEYLFDQIDSSNMFIPTEEIELIISIDMTDTFERFILIDKIGSILYIEKDSRLQTLRVKSNTELSPEFQDQIKG